MELPVAADVPEADPIPEVEMLWRLLKCALAELKWSETNKYLLTDAEWCEQALVEDVGWMPAPKAETYEWIISDAVDTYPFFAFRDVAYYLGLGEGTVRKIRRYARYAISQ